MSNKKTILVEVVAASAADCLLAQKCGAQRVELLSSLEVGGITPSLGLVEEVLETCALPVMAMIRARGGDFRYSETEMSTMVRDCRAFIRAGVPGLVFGVLDEQGEIDVEACSRLVDASEGRETIFHRAFDSTPDPFKSIDQLIRLGFTRILTSGNASSALEGADLLSRLREHAAGRIGILAGGGIRAESVRPLLARSELDQFHLAAMHRIGEHPGPYGEGYLGIDQAFLRAVVVEAENFGRQ